MESTDCVANSIPVFTLDTYFSHISPESCDLLLTVVDPRVQLLLSPLKCQ